MTGIAAVNGLETESLAAYALLTSAYRVMNQFPARFIFSPSEIIAIDSPVEKRLGSLAFSAPRGTLVSVVSALAVPLGAFTVAGEINRQDLVALSLTAVLLASASPIQDHFRAVFHMSQISWMAAAMSAVNFVGTGFTLLLFSESITWMVFGALFVGNALSLVVGTVWILRRRPARPPRPSLRDLSELGGWLLLTGLGKTGIRYVLTALLGIFAGIAALGFIEAARVVSQPVRVFAQGVMTQVGPRMTEAGSKRDRVAASQWIMRFLGLLGLIGVPYFVLVGHDWAINPFYYLAPRAYEVPGLVAATIWVVVAAAFADALRLILLGARQQRMVAVVTFIAGFVELAATPSGLLVGAYAAPLSATIALSVTIVWFRRLLRRSLRIEDPEGS